MQLAIDTDLTSHYAEGWAVTLTISPDSNSAHLAWSPSGREDSKTFTIRLGLDPLDAEAVEELRRAFEEFPGLDDIRAASWEYSHGQNRWRWAEGPWWGAVAALEARLYEVLDAWL
ncbi:hypothetical protein [Streptomyces sp. NPDC015350]|uniref:hypothetical protein n=1 Tax=Streptomyces sp. NPDC015350 TaxID=3364955 RepID=UPI0036FB93AE